MGSNFKGKSTKLPIKVKELQVIRWFNFGSFPGYWVYIQNFSHKEIMRHLKKVKAEEWRVALDEPGLFGIGPCRAGRRDVRLPGRSLKNLFFIIMPDGVDPTDPEDMIRLAHECVHICQFYLPEVLDRNKEYEAEAYLHTHLMKQIVEHLNTPL